MLEKPTELLDSEIIITIVDTYGIAIREIIFLPLGADVNTVVYRAVDGEGNAHFVKIRRGDFHPATVQILRLLVERGVKHIIAPIRTKSGELWATMGDDYLMLFPFVQGQNGFEADLTKQHWSDLGVALKGLHTLDLPPDILDAIPQENFSDAWREALHHYLADVQTTVYGDAVANELAAFLLANQVVMYQLLKRANELVKVLCERELPFVLCHADIHAGNMLIDEHGALWVVDWDTMILAPKERDLMFIGAGIAGIGHQPHEIDAFYSGYGETQIHHSALAYYRVERVIQDIVEFCRQIFDREQGLEDRKQGLRFLKSQFVAGNEVDIALAT